MPTKIQDRFLHPSDVRVLSTKVTAAAGPGGVPTEQVFYSDFASTKPLYRWELSYDNGSTSDHPDIIVRRYIKGVWES